MDDLDASRSNIPNDIEEETDLRAAVQYAVLQICNEEDQRAGNTRTSPHAVASLAELAFLYATQSMAPDLDAYSNHAGRRTITEADVKLILRKNHNGLSKLQSFCEEHCSSANSDGAKRKAKRRKEKAVTIDLQRKKPKEQVYEPSSEDSSSDDDLSAQLDLAASTSRVAALPKPALHDSLLDGSDDDEVQILDAGPPFKRPTAAEGALEDTSDDNNARPNARTGVDAPDKRFRLGLRNKSKNNDTIFDSSDGDDDLDGPIFKASTVPTKKDAEESRVLSIMANMSMDSIPSDDANK